MVSSGFYTASGARPLANLNRLALLVRGEDRLAAEFDALGLGVGAAPCCAFEDAAAFELVRNAKSEVVSRNGSVSFSRNTFSQPAPFSWANRLVRSWASVETRA
jgi:hypothetical protein